MVEYHDTRPPRPDKQINIGNEGVFVNPGHFLSSAKVIGWDIVDESNTQKYPNHNIGDKIVIVNIAGGLVGKKEPCIYKPEHVHETWAEANAAFKDRNGKPISEATMRHRRKKMSAVKRADFN